MIRTEALTKRYTKDHLALDRLNLSVGQGDIFGYIGPNGAGKSTTIKILSGLLRPTSGRAAIDGVDIIARPRRAKELVGYLPEFFGVYAGMRVWEYLDFFGAAYRLPRRLRRTRVEEVMTVTGIAGMRDYFVDTLSKGMRQRVGVAKTLVHDPKVLFLDEPASGLDPRARIEMRELLKRLKARGKTILVSSHILPELASVCDRIGILEQGHLLVCDTVAEVMRRVQQRRVIDIEFLEDADRAVRYLKETQATDRLEVVETTGRLVRVSFGGDDEAAAGLLADLVREGLRPVWQTEVSLDLEQIYLKVTEAAQAGARRMVGHE